MSELSTGHVFMSYSRRDDVVMRRILTFLRQQGIKVWVDNEKLIPGTPVWEVEIEKAIKSAPAIVVVLSPDSKDSEWVRREISLADQYRKRVFPVMVRGDEESSISLRLIGRQYVDIRKHEEAGLNYVSTSLLRYLEELDAQEQKAQKDTSRLAAQKAENEGIAREKEDFAHRNAEIYNRSREAAAEATQAFLPKLKIPALILVIGVVGYFLWQGISSLIPIAPDATKTPLATTTLAPTKTKAPAPTKTFLPTQELGIGSTMTGEHGETLVYVPAGEFTMGYDHAEKDERPAQKIYLDAFWIDQFEVTNKQYQDCVDAGTCEPPSSKSSYTHPSYYENPEFDDYPVLYVTWDKANRYCEVWAGGDLPTEAQWEKAARGTEAFTYPWGNDAPNKDLLNYNSTIGDTTEVGSYQSGKSPYNTYDMAGNVWEWVNDYYQSDYYATLGDNASNPQGPTSSDYRVLRGGSWDDYLVNYTRSSYRYWVTPDTTVNYVGFRCARSLP